MARSFPAQTMGQVTVKLLKVTPVAGGKGTMRTHYSYTLQQADRDGAIRLNEEGKIVEILNPDVRIELPEGLGKEDVFALTPAPAPE